MAKLIQTLQGTALREYPLSGGKVRIGRSPDNEIQLDDDAVSGYHTELVVMASQYMEGVSDVWATDLESTNGTIVNGKRIQRHLLRHEDCLQVGTHSFKFIDDDAGSALRTTRILLDAED